ncbi:hypothetical protein RZS08_21685, partial [Arthrospira platensis SPKY1]|nr:hypothetical protein [Arthrospira platensis SPKY1]
MTGASQGAQAAMFASQFVNHTAPVLFPIDGLEPAQRLAMPAFHTEAIIDSRGAAADEIFLMLDSWMEQQVQVRGVHVAIAEHLVGR